VPNRVAELFELIEHHDFIGPCRLQCPCLVVDFFDVAFRPGGGVDFRTQFLEPLESLPGHAFGQYRDRRARQQVCIIGPAPAVISGRGPQRLVFGGVEDATYQFFHKRGKGRSHLVRARWKVFAQQHQDSSPDPGQLGRQFDKIDSPESTALRHRFVLPVDPEQVPGVEVPQTQTQKLVPARGSFRPVWR